MSQEKDPGKRIVNSHLNLNNLVSVSEYKDILQDTLDQIIDLLFPHCGPKSQYAMIFKQSQQLNFDPNLFLKDGIQIVSALEYVSPIQAYLKNMLAYIGSRVDNMAKDGTTTSVILAALFLKAGLQDYDKIRGMNLTTVEQESVYKTFCDIINDYIKLYSFDMKSLSELFPDKHEHQLAGDVALMQALSSSGGNTSLAKCLRQIFVDTPRAGWNLQHWTGSHLETEVPFSVKYPEYEFTCPAQCLTPDIFNSAMDTEFKVNKALVFAHPGPFIDGDLVTTLMYTYLEHYPDKKKPLVIICTTADSKFIQYVNQLNKTRTVRIALFTRMDFNRNLVNTPNELYLEALNAMASKTPYIKVETSKVLSERDNFIPAKYVWFNGRNVYIGGIAKYDKTLPVHYNYTHPKRCRYYTNLLNHIQQTIKDHDSSHKIVQLELRERCDEIHKLLVCPKAPNLFLGGTSHEHTSNRTVAQDVIGATMSSINNGFFINGLLTLLRMLHHIKEDSNNRSLLLKYGKHGNSPFLKLLIENVITSVEQVVIFLYGEDGYEKVFVSRNLMVQPGERSLEYYNLLNLSKPHYLDKFLNLTDKAVMSEKALLDYPVLQPVAIYQELFKRVGELMLKLIATDKFIAPGGVVLSRTDPTVNS